MTDDPRVSTPATERSLGELRFPMDVRIPNDVRYIEQIVGIVAERCAEQAMPARMCRLNIPVALTEALANAIMYGNGRNRAKGVRFRATIDERALVLEVTDEGDGFDLEECTTDPTVADNLVREDGRGLFLMRRLVDRVERFQQDGNVVRLTLHRT
jgi:serine/threonine-protein kinase RsbW